MSKKFSSSVIRFFTVLLLTDIEGPARTNGPRADNSGVVFSLEVHPLTAK